MAVAARWQFLLDKTMAGHQLHVALSYSAHSGRCKVKVVVDPRPALVPMEARTMIQQVLGQLASVSQNANTMDRGHKHSDGRSAVAFWIGQHEVPAVAQQPPNDNGLEGEAVADKHGEAEAGAGASADEPELEGDMYDGTDNDCEEPEESAQGDTNEESEEGAEDEEGDVAEHGVPEARPASSSIGSNAIANAVAVAEAARQQARMDELRRAHLDRDKKTICNWLRANGLEEEYIDLIGQNWGRKTREQRQDALAVAAASRTEDLGEAILDAVARSCG